MALNISKARVTVTLEMDYIDSHYVLRNHEHISNFFREVVQLQERYEALAENPDDPKFKAISTNVIKCEYFSNGEWTSSN